MKAIVKSTQEAPLVRLGAEERSLIARRFATKKNPALAYLSTLSEGASRKSMTSAINIVSRLLHDSDPTLGPPDLTISWHELDFDLVAGLRSRLQAKYAPKSANLYLAALRGVMNACADLGLVGADTLRSVCRAAKSVKGTRLPAGRALEDEEIGKLLAQCDVSTVIGSRDALMLVLLFGAGIRREEVSRLDISSIRGNALVVRGKGDKERRIAFPKKAFDGWMKIRGDEPGPLLLSTDGRIGKGDLTSKRMSPKAIWNRVHALSGAAGMKVSPHDFRRSFLTTALDDDEDANQLRQLVGHESLETTIVYDRRGEKVRDAIMDRFFKKHVEPLLLLVKGRSE